MSRLTHKSTDGLSELAVNLLTSGFRQKKTYAAIARDLAEIGVELPERTIARRAAEWRFEQARRAEAREQASALLAAMKENNIESAEMLRALATEALMSDPEAFTAADPVKVQRQNLEAEKIRLKREELELRKREHELERAKFEQMQERERKAAEVLERPDAKKDPGAVLNDIRALYGLPPQEAQA